LGFFNALPNNTVYILQASSFGSFGQTNAAFGAASTVMSQVSAKLWCGAGAPGVWPYWSGLGGLGSGSGLLGAGGRLGFGPQGQGCFWWDNTDYNQSVTNHEMRLGINTPFLCVNLCVPPVP
jgi:hypothetical protein